MQNAGIARLGLNWAYLAFDVHPERLAEAIRGAQIMHYVGLNLTVPHKQLAYELVDVLDGSAREWGAVNTIRFEGKRSDGAWVSLADPAADEFTETRSVGFNTDADAVLRALREDLSLELAQAVVLVVGMGGAGRVAALKLASAGVRRLYLVNRTQEKAAAVQSEIASRFPSCAVELGYPNEFVDVLVNGTSLGLKATDALPIDLGQVTWSNVGAVYDMIYQPAETPLLKTAKAANCRVANGLGMLVYQGAKALEIWCEKEAPTDVMRRALEEHIYS